MGREIGVGLIGTGFMGECHGLAYAAVGATFEPPVRPRPEMVADIGLAAAERAAQRFGFARATDDWKKLVTDPAVGLVAVASPNALHKEMALAAIAAGKHVYCEKPLALNAADAREMADAAARAGVVTLCGYNYLRSPAMQYAKRLIDEGVLGELTDVRFLFDEEYMADPAVPFSWRCRKATAGTGALGDMGSHVLSLARYLAGPITEVMTEFRTVIAKRPVPAGDGSREERAGPVAVDWSRMAEVENEDIVHALLRFRNGAVGHFGSSRLAWGRRNGIDIELYGSKGSMRFTQERFNEIDLFLPDADRGSNGFRTILTGPEHPPYGRFSPAGGHGLGFNDLKVAEVAHLMAAIGGEAKAYPDFAEGAAIEEVCDAMVESAASGRWVKVPE